MKTMLTAAAVAALALMSVTAVPTAAAPSQPTVVDATPCTTKWKVTGKKVAVRMPKGDAPVASSNSPVVRYLHRGDVVTSCVEAIARTQSGPAYRKCGRDGHVWRIVRGGQVPATCLNRA
ncbi:hypothetical protein BU52_33025 [Streptomyces toyocaensis]|uniref:Secreted protein n=2 Tax=Streptomyces toyocaensis TaxID=55952 RepID=A0A081XHF2_STRTO|nr:hypothetical protein BU52_33025 [Streptomyces toyocaensis]